MNEAVDNFDWREFEEQKQRILSILKQEYSVFGGVIGEVCYCFGAISRII